MIACTKFITPGRKILLLENVLVVVASKATGATGHSEFGNLELKLRRNRAGYSSTWHTTKRYEKPPRIHQINGQFIDWCLNSVLSEA